MAVNIDEDRGERGNPPFAATVLSEINVTPFVDVMLVLLIIFMVTAPLMQEGIEVNIPRAKAKSLRVDEKTLIITIDREQNIYINKNRFALPEFEEKIKKIAEVKEENDFFLRADESVPYGFVVKVMGMIKGAGIERLGMITQPGEEAGKRGRGARGKERGAKNRKGS